MHEYECVCAYMSMWWGWLPAGRPKDVGEALGLGLRAAYVGELRWSLSLSGCSPGDGSVVRAGVGGCWRQAGAEAWRCLSRAGAPFLEGFPGALVPAGVLSHAAPQTPSSELLFSAVCSGACPFHFSLRPIPHTRIPSTLLHPHPHLAVSPWAGTNRQLSSPAAGRGTAGEALCGSRDSCAQLVGHPPPHRASYQVARSCRQITPLLVWGVCPPASPLPCRCKRAPLCFLCLQSCSAH